MADLRHLGVIFDLDGTLIDSVPDIHAAANRVLGARGHAPLDRAVVQGYVGNGLPHLVARLLVHVGEVPDAALLAQTIARFEAEYIAAHDLTTVYPGVVAALDDLAAQGAALAICTNKPLRPAQAVLAHLGLSRHFPVILGGDSLPVRKPDPEHLHATARALNRPKVLFVGDSEVDAETAQAAGVPFLLYTEGYRKSPVAALPHSASFDHFAQLPALVTARA